MEPLTNQEKLDSLREKLLEKKMANVRIQSELTILRKDKEFKDFLINKFQVPDNPQQILWSIVNSENGVRCECGKLRKFNTYSKGYLETCGDKSCIDSNRLLTLRESTMLKHGVDHPTKLKSTRDNYRKTMMERYGSEHNWSGKPRESMEKTMVERYGAKHALQNYDILKKQQQSTIDSQGTLNMLGIKKTKDTNLSRYGFENAAKSPEISSKVGKSNKIKLAIAASAKLKSYQIELVDHDTTTQYYSLLCNKCSNSFVLANSCVNVKLRRGADPCPFCNKSDISNRRFSKAEKSLADYVISVYGPNVLLNRKYVLKGTELDIFLPKEMIAIEFNGTYWHSEMEKPSQYHINKTMLAHSHGIKLHHVWEDDWSTKRPIVESMINNFVGMSKSRIFARKCTIDRMDSKKAKDFCEENHLKGGKRCTIAYGLFYESELVEVMTFVRKSEIWELERLCTKLNTSVIGGASKLFSRFVREIGPARVISFCDVDISPDPTCTVYHKLGFKLLGRSNSYSWVVNGIRMPRNNFMKHKLVLQGEDPTKTELQIMHERGLYRTFECGNWKFEWSADNL
jgi:hypothetical protein